VQKFLVGAATVIAVIGVVMGSKFMAKADQAKKLEAKLTEICAGEKECLAAVSTHFQGCFDSAYDLGSRYRSGSVNPEKFTNCINTKSGAEFFSYEK
jgi:hypothetical protein